MDLYYRLNVVRLEVPPLRERTDDVPLLVDHFLARCRCAGSQVEGIEDDALDLLLRHAWPGNVRELENVVESAAALTRGERIGISDLPFDAAPLKKLAPSIAGIDLSLEAYERSALERALLESAGDVRVAARLLGIGRSTFYRKLAQHRIQA